MIFYRNEVFPLIEITKILWTANIDYCFVFTLEVFFVDLFSENILLLFSQVKRWPIRRSMQIEELQDIHST